MMREFEKREESQPENEIELPDDFEADDDWPYARNGRNKKGIPLIKS